MNTTPEKTPEPKFSGPASVRSIIENNFTYHPPKQEQIAYYEMIRNQAKDLALFIDQVCPLSREKMLALTKLEECVMWANASIARNA